jgi:predicted nucleotide-binding protein
VEPAAGISTTERLQAMLDDAGFAFVIMTAEDKHADGRTYARPNVIHESGLFQGKLGTRRAIVMLEEGCSDFSNISGLTQIRFPKDDMRSAFEDVRRVLRREKLI